MFVSLDIDDFDPAAFAPGWDCGFGEYKYSTSDIARWKKKNIRQKSTVPGINNYSDKGVGIWSKNVFNWRKMEQTYIKLARLADRTSNIRYELLKKTLDPKFAYFIFHREYNSEHGGVYSFKKSRYTSEDSGWCSSSASLKEQLKTIHHPDVSLEYLNDPFSLRILRLDSKQHYYLRLSWRFKKYFEYSVGARLRSFANKNKDIFAFEDPYSRVHVSRTFIMEVEDRQYKFEFSRFSASIVNDNKEDFYTFKAPNNNATVQDV